jgi:hypothetical protein
MKRTLKTNPFTSKVLDVSTVHISQEDNELLVDTHLTESPIIAYQSDCGYFVYIPQDKELYDGFPEKAKSFGHSKAFINLIDKARNMECQYIHLDRDGTTYSDIPKFKWE